MGYLITRKGTKYLDIYVYMIFYSKKTQITAWFTLHTKFSTIVLQYSNKAVVLFSYHDMYVFYP